MKRPVSIIGMILLPWGSLALADEPAIPSDTPSASHYQTLWTKSPFSVATPDAVEDSPDYSLVGITQLEGVSYASIVEKQNSDHFLISSDKENKGLLLKSISRSANGGDTFATVEKNGQVLTLKLESALIAPPTTPAPGMPNMSSITVPPVTQNIPMPGANLPPPGPLTPASTRFMRIHRPTIPIHVPPMPNPNQPATAPAAAPQASDPTGATPPAGAPPAGDNGQGAQAVQPHTPPPPQ